MLYDYIAFSQLLVVEQIQQRQPQSSVSSRQGIHVEAPYRTTRIYSASGTLENSCQTRPSGFRLSEWISGLNARNLILIYFRIVSNSSSEPIVLYSKWFIMFNAIFHTVTHWRRIVKCCVSKECFVIITSHWKLIQNHFCFSDYTFG